MPAKYRKLSKRFWTDSRVRSLDPIQKLIFAYAITSPEACTNTLVSGIYEIHRSDFERVVGLTHHEVNDALNHFNEKKPELLEYDFENHMIYVKSFFKHNGGYKPDTVSCIIEDFNETFDKAPQFWAHFGSNYRERLGKIMIVLQDREHVKFLERLFNLESELNDIKPKPALKALKTKKLENKNSLSCALAQKV